MQKYERFDAAQADVGTGYRGRRRSRLSRDGSALATKPSTGTHSVSAPLSNAGAHAEARPKPLAVPATRSCASTQSSAATLRHAP